MVGENWFQHLPRNSSEIIYPPWDRFPISQPKRESGKIVDSKVPAGMGYMLVRSWVSITNYRGVFFGKPSS